MYNMLRVFRRILCNLCPSSLLGKHGLLIKVQPLHSLDLLLVLPVRPLLQCRNIHVEGGPILLNPVLCHRLPNLHRLLGVRRSQVVPVLPQHRRRVALPEATHARHLSRSQLRLSTPHSHYRRLVIARHKNALAETAVEFFPRVRLVQLAQLATLHEGVPALEGVHARLAVGLHVLHEHYRLGVGEIATRRQIISYSSRLGTESTRRRRIRPAVYIYHVETLRSQEGRQQFDGFLHDTAHQHKPVVVALRNLVHAHSHIGIVQRVKGDHGNVRAGRQERFRGVSYAWQKTRVRYRS